MITPRKGKIKQKGYKTMSENKGLVKCAFGFLVVICILIGGIAGFDVDIKVADMDTTNVSEETTDTEGTNVIDQPQNDVTDVPHEDTEVTDKTENKEDANVNEDAVIPEDTNGDTADDETVADTENSTDVSAPSEDKTPSVDESVKEEVTNPTDKTEDVVTEGENENA